MQYQLNINKCSYVVWILEITVHVASISYTMRCVLFGCFDIYYWHTCSIQSVSAFFLLEVLANMMISFDFSREKFIGVYPCYNSCLLCTSGDSLYHVPFLYMAPLKY